MSSVQDCSFSSCVNKLLVQKGVPGVARVDAGCMFGKLDKVAPLYLSTVVPAIDMQAQFIL